jgi:hypothetical protein
MQVQANEKRLKLNGKRQLLIYADYINFVGSNVCTMTKDTEALLIASKETTLEVTAKENTYMFMSHEQNGGKPQYKQ